jgi:hypothetical protein
MVTGVRPYPGGDTSVTPAAPAELNPGVSAGSLQNLQAEQRRSGFALRGDIASSWKRMEHYMDQAEAALSAKNTDEAKENMENAEREISTLEKFLGR